MNHERLKVAIDIIRSIPDDRFSLRLWQTNVDQTNGHTTKDWECSCGTIACAGGWLALHPDMRSQGLYPGRSGEPRIGGFSGYDALAEFFEIGYQEARALFCPRLPYERKLPHLNPLSDKELWLYRMELFNSNPDRFVAFYLD
jgi:hypothetical protein